MTLNERVQPLDFVPEDGEFGILTLFELIKLLSRAKLGGKIDLGNDYSLNIPGEFALWEIEDDDFVLDLPDAYEVWLKRLPEMDAFVLKDVCDISYLDKDKFFQKVRNYRRMFRARSINKIGY